MKQWQSSSSSSNSMQCSCVYNGKRSFLNASAHKMRLTKFLCFLISTLHKKKFSFHDYEIATWKLQQPQMRRIFIERFKMIKLKMNNKPKNRNTLYFAISEFHFIVFATLPVYFFSFSMNGAKPLLLCDVL